MCTDHNMLMAWSRIGPARRKKYAIINYWHILGNLNCWALQGPKQQETAMQPIKTRTQTKLGSAELKH